MLVVLGPGMNRLLPPKSLGDWLKRQVSEQDWVSRFDDDLLSRDLVVLCLDVRDDVVIDLRFHPPPRKVPPRRPLCPPRPRDLDPNPLLLRGGAVSVPSKHYTTFFSSHRGTLLMTGFLI